MILEAPVMKKSLIIELRFVNRINKKPEQNKLISLSIITTDLLHYLFISYTQ